MDDNRTTLIISTEGDASVGIDGNTAEVLLYVEPDELEFVKEILATAFGDIWGEAVTIFTDAELKAAEACNPDDGPETEDEET